MSQYTVIVLFFASIHSLLAQNNTTILPNPLLNECGKIEYASEYANSNLQSNLGEHPWVAAIIYWFPGKRAPTLRLFFNFFREKW